MIVLKSNFNNKIKLPLVLSSFLICGSLFAATKEHTVKSGESLYNISKKYDLSVDELKKLNNLKSDKLSLGQKLVVSKKGKKDEANSDNKKKKKESGSSAKTHTVKSGDNLYNIAKKYNISVDQLKEWNDLSSNRLDRGQKLFVSETQNSSTQNNRQTDSRETAQNDDSNSSAQDISSGETYKVKKGETLSSIAKKFDISLDKLKKMNNLKSSKVKVGQILTVQTPSSRPQNSTTPSTTVREQNNYKTHIVNRNETLYSISKKYKMTENQVMNLNKLKSKRLKKGQKLKVYDNTIASLPAQNETIVRTEPVRLQQNFVIVKKGQTLYNIAKTYNMDIVDLIDYNNLRGFEVKQGQKIWLEPGHQNQTEENETQQAKPQEQNIQTVPVHIVSRGENLFRIAKNYNVSVDDLKKWNKLNTLTVKEGQKIYIGNPSEMMAQQDVEFSRPNKQIIKPYSRTPILPLSSAKVISNFGMRGGRMHKGIDFGAPTGEPIYATLPGRVVFSGVQRGYGNVIILEHENFVMTVYGHNDVNLVKVGDEVTQGQIIGTVGATGNAQGSHLHFEYRVRGVAINPRDLLIGLP
jgi:LysM repeat protein